MPATPIGQGWDIVPFSGNRTLALEDVTTLLSSLDGAGQVITFPPEVDVTFSEGDQFSFEQNGAGALSFAPGAGVTINSQGALLAANGQFAVASAIYKGSDIWLLFGDLV